MPATFPSISIGSVCLYPVARTISVPTRVLQFCDGKEQRFRTGPILNGWSLTFSDIVWADVLTLRTFHATCKGGFDHTWTFPFSGVSYTNCAFEHDDFTAVENSQGRYSVTLKFRQVQQSGTYSTGLDRIFPLHDGVHVTQLPATTTSKFWTSRNRLECGREYSYYWRATPLMTWIVTLAAITPADLGAMLDFFCSMGGRYRAFSFTDPNTSTEYPNCHFGADVFEAKYVQAGHCSVELPIEEFAA